MDIAFLLENVQPVCNNISKYLSMKDFTNLGHVNKHLSYLAPRICVEFIKELLIPDDIPAEFQNLKTQEKFQEFNTWIKLYGKNIKTLDISSTVDVMTDTTLISPRAFPDLTCLIISGAGGKNGDFLSKLTMHQSIEKLVLKNWSPNTNSISAFSFRNAETLTEFSGEFVRFEQCRSAWDILCTLPVIRKISIELQQGTSEVSTLQLLLFPYCAHTRQLSENLEIVSFKTGGNPKHASVFFGKKLVNHLAHCCLNLKELRVDFTGIAFDCLEYLRWMEHLEILEFVFDSRNFDLLQSFFKLHGAALKELHFAKGSKYGQNVSEFLDCYFEFIGAECPNLEKLSFNFEDFDDSVSITEIICIAQYKLKLIKSKLKCICACNNNNSIVISV